MAPSKAINTISVKTFALFALLIYVLFLCFWDLGGRSLAHPDESVEVQAAQEMLSTGRWWLPTNGGRPFFDKPPFKMWCSFLPVSVFGQSNFSWRFVDATCGFLSALLLCVFSFRLFRSWFISILSTLCLFGCDIYVSYHGVRTAVQDSMLIFLSCAALLAGYELLMGRRRWLWASLGGLSTGLAVLTKSAGGLIAPYYSLPFSPSRVRPGGILERSWGPYSASRPLRS